MTAALRVEVDPSRMAVADRRLARTEQRRTCRSGPFGLSGIQWESLAPRAMSVPTLERLDADPGREPHGDVSGLEGLMGRSN